MKALTCALALFLATPAMAQEVIDHPQWIYRDIDGAEQAAAVFLSWDYRSVIVRATCEEGGRLRIEYFSGVSSVAAEPMTLIVDERATPMDTTLDTAGERPALVGRAPATAELAFALRHAVDVQLDAPNEMNEPWYLGRAEPLARIVSQCAARGSAPDQRPNG